MDQLIMWSPGVSLESIERQVIQKAYGHFKQNKTATANALGIAVRTLDNKLEKFKLDDETEKKANAERQEARARQLERARGLAPAQNVYEGAESRAQEDLVRANAEHARNRPNAGVRVEPTLNAAAEHAVPMPERREIQDVLPKQAASGGTGKRR